MLSAVDKSNFWNGYLVDLAFVSVDQVQIECLRLRYFLQLRDIIGDGDGGGDGMSVSSLGSAIPDPWALALRRRCARRKLCLCVFFQITDSSLSLFGVCPLSIVGRNVQ